MTERLHLEVTADAKDLRKALDGAAGDLTGFGRTAKRTGDQATRAGAQISQGMDKGARATEEMSRRGRLAVHGLEGDLRKLDRMRVKPAIDVDTTGAMAQVAALKREISSLNGRGGGIGFKPGNVVKLIKPAALLTAAGFGGQLLNSGVAGGGAAVSELTSLAGLYPAVAQGALAAGTALGTVKLATTGLSGAMTAQTAAQDGTAASAKKYRQELAKLTPEARSFVKTLGTYRPIVSELQRTAQKGLFPGAEKGLRDLKANRDVIKQIVAETSKVLGRNAGRAGAFLGSKSVGRDLAGLGKENADILDRGARAGMNFANAARHIVVEAEPLTKWLSLGVLHLSQLAEQEAAAGRKSGALAAFFEHTQQVAGKLAGTVAGVATGLGQVVKAAQPLGDDILSSLEQTAQQWGAWTKTMEGHNALAHYFASAKPALFEAGQLVHDLVLDILHMGNTPAATNLIHQLRTQLLPVLVNLVNSTTAAFGPHLVNALVQIAKLFGDIAGSSGPLVHFVDLIGGAAGLLHKIITGVPVLHGAIVSLAGGIGIAKALKLAATLTGLGKVVGLIKAAKVEAAAGGGLGSIISKGLGGGKGPGGLGSIRGATPETPLYVWVVNGGLPGGGAGGKGPGGILGRIPGAGAVTGLVPAGAGVAAGSAAAAVAAVGVEALVFRKISNDRSISAFTKQLKELTATHNLQGLRDLRAEFEKYGSFPGGIDKARASIDAATKSVEKFQAQARKQTLDSMRQDLVSNWHVMSRETGVSLHDMANNVRSNMALIRQRMHDDPEGGRKALATNFKLAADAIRDRMKDGEVNVRRGTAMIHDDLIRALQALGLTRSEARAKFETGTLKNSDDRPGASTIPKHAVGGLVTVGRSGERGRDDVPAVLNGQPAIVARGEDVAVFNHHQRAVVDGALAAQGYGGLPGLFNTVTTPHYMARGGHIGKVTTGLPGGVGQMVQRSLDVDRSAAQDMLSQVAGSTGSGGPSGAQGPVPAGSVRSWLTQALKITGHFSAANLAALFSRTMQESGGNPHAINLWDSNAKAGHPSKGLLQTIDGTFSSHMLPGHGDIWNPVDNAIAAIRYMFASYGHIVGASSTGYSRGGLIHAAGGAHVSGRRPLNQASIHGSTRRRSRKRRMRVPQPYDALPQLKHYRKATSHLDHLAGPKGVLDFAELKAGAVDEQQLMTLPDGTQVRDETGIATHLGELTELMGIQDQILTAEKAQATAAAHAKKALEHAIRDLTKDAEKIRARVKKNIERMRAAKRERDKATKDLATERAKKGGGSKTRKTQLQAKIKALNATITGLGQENTALTGATDTVGTGGQLAGILSTITARKQPLGELTGVIRDANYDETATGIAHDQLASEYTTWSGTKPPASTAPADPLGLLAISESLRDDAVKNLNLQTQDIGQLTGFNQLLGLRLVGAFAHGTDRVRETGLAVVHKDETITPDPQGPYGSQLKRGGDGGSMALEITVRTERGEVLGIVRQELRQNGQRTVSQQTGRMSRLIAAAPGG